MTKFKCIRSFKSHSGRDFYYGNKLDYQEYCLLPYSEQNNFNRIYDEEREMRYLPEDEQFNANDLEVSKED